MSLPGMNRYRRHVSNPNSLYASVESDLGPFQMFSEVKELRPNNIFPKPWAGNGKFKDQKLSKQNTTYNSHSNMKLIKQVCFGSFCGTKL